MSQFTSSVAGSQWERKRRDIASATFAIVDNIPLTSFRGVRYIFCAYNKAQDRSKMFDMSVIQNSGSIKENLFGIIGQGLNLSVDTLIVSGNLNVKVTNNEAFTLTVELVKTVFN